MSSVQDIPAGLLKFDLEGVTIEGNLVIPPDAKGLVIFSHGSGSSRFSPRNNFVARHLQEKGLGTFLFDLLTREEDADYSNRFNIDLLSYRLQAVTEELIKFPKPRELPLGYFGASTGAASAIRAAVMLKDKIKAVVSRGGRPDMAPMALGHLLAPTLLIVGELDMDVIEMNRRALEMITATKELRIVKGATHLFEEPGALEEVAKLSGAWFGKYLGGKE